MPAHGSDYRATEVGSLRRLFMRAGRLDAAQWSAERIVSPSADVVMMHPLEQLEVRQQRALRTSWIGRDLGSAESNERSKVQAASSESSRDANLQAWQRQPPTRRRTGPSS